MMGDTEVDDDMALYQVLHVSQAAHTAFDMSDLDILKQGVSMNAKRGITGFLRREEGHFIQVLEGPRDNLIELLDKIMRDRRHFNMRIIDLRRIETREFPDWSFGYDDEGPRDALPGCLPLDKVPAPLLLDWMRDAAHQHFARIAQMPLARTG